MAHAGAALRRFVASPGRRGVLVDFDGTLSPIVDHPDLASIADGGNAALAEIADRFAVVAVVSGRTQRELALLVDAPGVQLVGSYGLEPFKLPPAVLDAVRAGAAGIPGAFVEPKGASIAVHVRGTEDPDAAEAALVGPLTAIGDAHGLEIIEGKRVLELVPAGRPLKEGAVERLVAQERLEAVLYAGDDVADLRAFEALDRAALAGIETVKVAVQGAETPLALIVAADLVLDGPAELVRFLQALGAEPAAD